MSSGCVVTGRVLREGDAGAGIAGVSVTDGLSTTQTDATGRYRLPMDPNRRHTSLVYITVPAGWQAPAGDSGVPAFFRKVAAAGGQEVNVDFVLRADPAAEHDEYRFVALADVHVQAGSVNTRETFGGQLGYLNALAREIDQGSGPPRFVTVAGDLTNDATPAEFQDYLSALTASSIPVWSAPGNHDLNGRTPGGPHRESGFPGPYRDVIDGYRQAVGPEWYSFQYGPHHFVVLENYRGLGEPDQLSWLGQDLALNAAGKQVVVVTHVPWNVPQTAAEHAAAYLELLGRYDVRLLLAGHTHSNDVVSGVVGRAVQAVTTSAVSTLDQTPRGYRLVEFRDGGVELPYGELDADRRPTVVYPVGAVRSPSTVRVSRYHPPGVAAEVEYQIPPHPWQPLRPLGTRSWTADLDARRLEPTGPRQLLVRARDHPTAAWTESDGSTFDVVADGSAVVPRQGTPWPMFHRDARHSGHSADAVSPPLRLAWVRHSGGAILTSSPALAHEAVFVGTRDENGEHANGVIALDLATGLVRWRTATPGAVEASVAVADDLVLASAVRGPLHAVEAGTGQVRWDWMPDHPGSPHCWMYFSPTVADGSVYQAYSVASGTWVIALDAKSGEPNWRTSWSIGRNWVSHASPAVDGDLLVFATAYANLVALDATSGAVRWQTALGAGLGVRAKPVIADGIVLLACQGDLLVAVEADSGQVRWRYEAAGETLLPGAGTAATPAVVDGLVYAAFTDGSVVALRLDTGDLIWRQQTQGAVLSSPAISGDILYVGSNDGRLRALDRGTGGCRWAHDLGAWVASSPAVTGNAVVAAAWDGNVYAFTGCAGA